MLENKISGLINKHIKDNFWLYVISLLCIFTGIVVGIYSVRYMGGFEKSDLVNYLKNFTTAVNSGNLNYKSILLQTLKNNIPVILAIWFLGLTMIGIPIILVIDVIKGFTIGFTISFIINQLGIKGIWISLAGVMPQNIIYIPCIIISSVLAMEFSLMIFRDKSRTQWKSHILVSITSYSIYFLIVSMVMCIGFLWKPI